MTKSDLINRMCEAGNVPVGRSEQIVNAIFDAVEQALKRGERVEIRGFGSFEVRAYRGYVGRNPRSGSTVEVKPKRLAFFKVGKELKDRVQRSGILARTANANANAVANAPVTAPTLAAEVAQQARLLPPSHTDDGVAAVPRGPAPAKHASLGASR
ncbi:MAG: HU family DNA-binding protein [Polyangia bacterium]